MELYHQLFYDPEESTPPMRLTQLIHFAQVSNLKSFSRAAEALGLTQPSLSYSVAKLEEDLGVKLLVRSYQGVELSDFGAAVIADVHEALAAVERIQQAADSAVGRQDDRLRIGAIPIAGRTMLGPALKTFRMRHPNTEISISEGGTHQVMDMMAAGDLDIAIVSSREQIDGTAWDFEVELLGSTTFVLCVPSEHSLTAKATVRPRDLENEPFIAYRDSFLLQDFIADVFEPKPDQIAHVADSIEQAIWFVKQGLGVTVLGEHALPAGLDDERDLFVHRPISDVPTQLHAYLMVRPGDKRPIVAECVDLVGSRIGKWFATGR